VLDDRRGPDEPAASGGAERGCYDKDVFNGDIGCIAAIDTDEGLVQVELDGRLVDYDLGELDELALAYATSVHKAQGSEFPAVVIPLAIQHYTLLEPNLLYTAVTCGRRLVVLIAEPRALAIAVKRTGSNKRLTRLRERLIEMVATGSRDFPGA
jgi:exodeoxyribonuclease V alpha subunit